MGQAIFVNQINHKYLMNKTKEDMASLFMWVLNNKIKYEQDVAALLKTVTENLDDADVLAAMVALRNFKKKYEPLEIEE